MTQKEKKNLLLKDLCARLPYEVQCEIGGLQHGPYTFTGNDVEDLIAGRMFKPYLRPMSSMTEEEKKEYHKTFRAEPYGSGSGWVYVESIHSFDWLNKKMFDYRGLIPKGLAIEVTESNNPYKD